MSARVLFALAVCCAACEHAERGPCAIVAGGDARRGVSAIERHGCAACHTITGVPGAHALVGPSLEHMGQRSYVAGVLANEPENLVAWILDPPSIDPLTAMPFLDVPVQDARDIASYLYTLR